MYMRVARRLHWGPPQEYAACAKRHAGQAAAAVDGSAPSTAAWKPEAVSTSAHADSFAYAIAAKISCAVAGSVGAVSCMLDLRVLNITRHENRDRGKCSVGTSGFKRASST
jgi:hypothetical protein